MATSTLVNTIQDGLRPSPAPAIEHYRDLSNITQLVASKPGMFWCYTHLLYMPLEKQSPDPRYCNACHGILMAEYRDMVSVRGKRKPWWTPANGSSHKTTPQVQEQGALIMSTSKGKNSTVDIFQPTVPTRRGPKNHVLPEGRIKQLAFAGMGSKEIATKLQGEGCSVSYKTVQRRLRQAVMA